MLNSKKIITPTPPRGMRDHLPQQLVFRQKIIDALKHVFELHGFLPLETPALERLETLSGKYGEEGDKLMFLVLKRGAELGRALGEVGTKSNPAGILCDQGLRYDFTVSLARVMAQFASQLPDPFKRYQIGPVWRADRPQLGRYREFTQCDVDIVNGDSPQADAEIVQLVCDGYAELEKQFQFPEWVLQINDRRLLSAFNLVCGNRLDQFASFCTALDKLD
ncbi:MAG: ATP phosphoribosyltransferase regulatory subunit, partial [Calditrichota bacterium]